MIRFSSESVSRFTRKNKVQTNVRFCTSIFSIYQFMVSNFNLPTHSEISIYRPGDFDLPTHTGISIYRLTQGFQFTDSPRNFNLPTHPGISIYRLTQEFQFTDSPRNFDLPTHRDFDLPTHTRISIY